MNIKAILAIAVCKILRFLSRLLHRGGTAMPGRIALKLCPDLLSRLASSVNTLVITGTNGKTTSARMAEAALEKQGTACIANRSGANLWDGITTEFVMNSTLTGKMKKHYAVIECDEGAAVKVFPQLQPKVILVTNLFRDQLDRYGEVTHTLESIRTAAAGAPGAVLCLNADCSLTASLAGDLPNRAVFYGLGKDATAGGKKPEHSDAAHCLRCGAEYEYDYISYDHLGHFRCPVCGYRRQESQYTVTHVIEQKADSSVVAMDLNGQKQVAEVNLPALYNVYNAVGVMAAVSEMGVPTDTALAALESFQCGFGRMERFPLAGGARMMLVKNPAGFDQVVRYLENIKEPFALLICLNDGVGDGKDISWIWDADYEGLVDLGSYVSRIMVSGARAEELRLRLKYAGIPQENILLEHSYDKVVAACAELTCPVYMMPNYTAMLELRSAVIKNCGGAEFWE